MELSGLMSGGAAVIKKYQVAIDIDNAGSLVLISGAADGGVNPMTTTSASDVVGFNYDTATFVTAQQTDGTSAERTVAVAINTDLILSALWSGSATNGTALSIFTETSGSSSGLLVTDSGTTLNSGPDRDDHAVFCFSGANAGQMRKCITSAANALTLKVAFDNDIEVGDVFYSVSTWPFDSDSDTLTMTTTLDQVRADRDGATNTANLTPIELLLKDSGEEGRTTSRVLLSIEDHFLNRGD